MENDDLQRSTDVKHSKKMLKYAGVDALERFEVGEIRQNGRHDVNFPRTGMTKVGGGGRDEMKTRKRRFASIPRRAGKIFAAIPKKFVGNFETISA